MRRSSFLAILLLLLLSFACSENVKKSDIPQVEKNTEIQLGTIKYRIKNVFLFKDGIIEKGINNIPLELREITNGRLTFENSKVTIVPVSKHISFSDSTNSVVNKLDVLNFIFSNLVLYKDEKNTNEEILKDFSISKIPTNSIKHQRSFIIETTKGNENLYILISEYNIEYYDLESTTISVWEDICWDKTISVNVTDKFANLILQKLRALRTNKFVYF